VFAALVILHAKRMWPILLQLRYFFHITTYKPDFRENVIELEMRVLIFSATLPEIFLLLRRIQRDIIINVHTSLRKAPVIFVRF
jgi:hypothetical protein